MSFAEFDFKNINFSIFGDYGLSSHFLISDSHYLIAYLENREYSDFPGLVDIGSNLI